MSKDAEDILDGLRGRLVSKDTFDRQTSITRELIRDLHQEIDTQRLVARYQRRKWQQYLFWVVLFTLHLRDLAAAHDGIWFAPVFFMTSHGGGPWEVPLRVAGGLLQAAAVVYLAYRTRVPSWLLERLTGQAISVEEYELKYMPKPE